VGLEIKEHGKSHGDPEKPISHCGQGFDAEFLDFKFLFDEADRIFTAGVTAEVIRNKPGDFFGAYGFFVGEERHGRFFDFLKDQEPEFFVFGVGQPNFSPGERNFLIEAGVKSFVGEIQLQIVSDSVDRLKAAVFIQHFSGHVHMESEADEKFPVASQETQKNFRLS